MHSHLPVPPELSFLNDQPTRLADLCAHFKILKSDFDSDTWVIEGLRHPIYFKIQLVDGSYLTDSKNRDLLFQIKVFIALQSHPLITGGLNFSKKHECKRIRIVLGMVDYFLLNSESVSFYKYGFKAISKGQAEALIEKIRNTTNASERFYGWSHKLRKHLLECISDRCQQENIPAPIREIPEEENFTLGMTRDEVLRARVFLYSSSTRFTEKEMNEKVFRPLVKAMYRNTLGGYGTKPIPPELRISHREAASPELPRSPVRSSHDDMVVQNLRLHMSCISSISALQAFEIDTPNFDISQLAEECIASHGSPPGRYISLPIDEILTSLKNGAEFFYAYGKDLLTSCSAVLCAAKHKRISPTKYAATYGIQDLIHENILNLGVKFWSFNSLSKQDRKKNSYHEFLRGNLGLLELTQVFYGAALVVMSATSARRQDELKKLHPLNSLDKSELLLRFYVGKSGFGDSQELVERPVPPLFVQIVEEIEKFQRTLIKAGVLVNYLTLFSIPGHIVSGLRESSYSIMNRCLDMFCDYFQSSKDKDANRHYVRLHQLRRFYVQLFYWSPAFRPLDTISWYLAHTNPEYLYYYITNEFPGSVLREVQAEFACETITRGLDTSLELELLVEEHFGTKDFSMLDKEELTIYLHHLIKTEAVAVEPDFSVTTSEGTYTIVIKVTHG